VADARDRQSGGAGPGLAIADRVIRIHGGTIPCENATPRGLLVEIQLPLSLSSLIHLRAHKTGAYRVNSYLAVRLALGCGATSGRIAVL
jgi:hypothetical protein